MFSLPFRVALPVSTNSYLPYPRIENTSPGFNWWLLFSYNLLFSENFFSLNNRDVLLLERPVIVAVTASALADAAIIVQSCQIRLTVGEDRSVVI